MTFPEPRWSVPGLFPDGLTVLAGRPKSGKSFLALQTAVAVASGGAVLDRVVDEGDVLYLALEDTARRLQDRLSMMHDVWPERLTFVFDPEDALPRTDRWLQKHPETRLVIVDTLARVRRPHRLGRPVYDEDYSAISEWKALADQHGVGIVTVHHTRKSAADDVIDLVNGSHGLTGAADTIAVLRRRQGDTHARLDVTGRDIPDVALALVWRAEDCTWCADGTPDEPAPSEARNDVLEILGALGPATPSEIAGQLGVTSNTVRQRLFRMHRAGAVGRNDDGRYVTHNAVTHSGTDRGDERYGFMPLPVTSHERDVDLLIREFGAVVIDEGPL